MTNFFTMVWLSWVTNTTYITNTVFANSVSNTLWGEQMDMTKSDRVIAIISLDVPGIGWVTNNVPISTNLTAFTLTTQATPVPANKFKLPPVPKSARK